MSDKVKAGDPLDISARDWNRMLEASEAFERERLTPRPSPPPRGARGPGWILVKNVSDKDVPRFGYLMLGDPVYEYKENNEGFKNQCCVEGELCSDDNATAPLVTFPEALPKGAIGWGLLAGATIAKIEVADADAEDFQFGNPISDGVEKFRATGVGPIRILWKEPGHGTGPSGDKWARVLQSGQTFSHYGFLHCKTGQTIAVADGLTALEFSSGYFHGCTGQVVDPSKIFIKRPGVYRITANSELRGNGSTDFSGEGQMLIYQNGAALTGAGEGIASATLWATADGASHILAGLSGNAILSTQVVWHLEKDDEIQLYAQDLADTDDLEFWNARLWVEELPTMAQNTAAETV